MKKLMFALVLIFGASMVQAQNPSSTSTPPAPTRTEKKAEKPTTPSDKATSGPARQTPPAATTAPAASKEMGRDHTFVSLPARMVSTFMHTAKKVRGKCTSACRTKGAKAEAAPAPKKMPAKAGAAKSDAAPAPKG
ncbi:MAG: hypothetical protein U0T81_15005 [Saprospiraceae bacterium]